MAKRTTVLFGGRGFILDPQEIDGRLVGWQIYEYLDFASVAAIGAVDDSGTTLDPAVVAPEAFRSWFQKVRRPCPDPLDTMDTPRMREI